MNNDSPQRVALDLAKFISEHEQAQVGECRDHFLELYPQCLRAVLADPADEGEMSE